MILRFAILALVVLAGCGGSHGSSSKQPTVGVTDSVSATKALGSLLSAVQQALAGAQPAVRKAAAETLLAAGTGTSMKLVCANGGSATANVTMPTVGSASTTESMTFQMCGTPQGTLDGLFTLDVQATATGPDIAGTATLDGAVAFTSADGAYSGDFAFNAMTVTYSCNATGCPTLTESGSYTVGGVTYQLDSSTFATFAGIL